MASSAIGKREVARRQERLRQAIAAQILELRLETGVTLRTLAGATGIDVGHLSRIERGLAVPALETLVGIAAALGADVGIRLFPNAGPRLRDRLQAPMIEALLRRLGSGWQGSPEYPVPKARGVVDLLVRNPRASFSIACEAHSQLRSVDLVLRRLHEKALGLTGDEGMGQTSALLLVRSTDRTRQLVRLHQATFAAAFPGRCRDAVAALAGDPAAWPGPTLLWARLEAGRAEILGSPPRGVAVGR